MSGIIYIGSDTDFAIDTDPLRLAATQAAINDAVLSSTLYEYDANAADNIGDPVADAEDLSMSYVSPTNGQYRLTLPAAVTSTLTQGAKFILVTTDDDGKFRHELLLTAQRRRN